MNRPIVDFFKRVFMLPRPFSEVGLEAAFLSDYAMKLTSDRRAALIMGLLTWTLFAGWDAFHGAFNQDIEDILIQILVLRGIGSLILVVLVAISFSNRYTCESFATPVLVLAIVSSYGLLLAMMIIVPFPFNYLYYYIGLLLVLIYLFGFSRLRAKHVLATTTLCLAVSVIIFMKPGIAPIGRYGQAASYYWIAAMTYLVAFSIVGYATSVELEATARRAFSRERELAWSNARLNDKYVELESLNDALRDSKRETEYRTAALILAKEDLRKLAEEESRSKSKFLADAAHDLRQPMQAFGNLLEAAKRSLINGDQKKSEELLDMTQMAARMMRLTFNSVLEISKLESGLVTAEYSDVDLTTLLDEIMASLQPVAPLAGQIPPLLAGSNSPTPEHLMPA